MFNVMSNNALRVARELAEPLVQGENRPIVFAEKRPRAGKGGAAFKSLTAAVKAAEREKEEARGYKLAAEHVLDIAHAKLKEAASELQQARKKAEAFRAFIRRWSIIFLVLLVLNVVVCVTGLLGVW